MMPTTTQASPFGEWRQLVAAALLGSERIGGALPAIGGAPGALLARLAADAAPAKLLSAAAVLAPYVHAGQFAGAAIPSALVAAAADALPPCSQRAGCMLEQILLGEYRMLLAEWMSLARRRGVRAPDELLPALLNACTVKDADLAGNDVRAVLGVRGQWLAALNPAWRSIIAADDPAVAWRTGLLAERLAALRTLRSCDSAAARALLVETWAQEEPDDRAAIMECLRFGLSQDDEPFLDDALADKRKPVRTEAADLLARLPDSRLRARMLERARGLVTLTLRKKLLRGAQLELTVQLPPELDKPMARDGLESRKQGGLGEKAYVLSQILAATTLSTWEEQSGEKPEHIVAAATDSEFKDALLLGWSRAAIRQRSPAWAAALLPVLATVSEAPDEDRITDLTACLDPPDRESQVSALLYRKGSRLGASGAVAALRGCRHAWSDAFTGAVLAALRRWFATPDAQYDHPLRKNVTQIFSGCMAPALAAEVAAGWPRDSTTWHKGDDEMVNTLAATLAFRQTLHEEFSGE